MEHILSGARVLMLTLVAMLSVSATRGTANALDADMTYEDLLEFIQTNDVRTIDELLPELPAYYRSEFTLMHDSSSLQKASLELPRVIMTGPRATLIIAFTDHPHSVLCE